MKQTCILIIVAVLMIPAFAARSTTVTTPDASPKSGIYQKVGLTDIKVTYHSPAVKKREIWGKLVPFGKVWRAGANENTVIKFSTDITVGGHLLTAGRYGLHMIPGEKEWTIIFSKNHSSWGSYFYNKKDDALRVNVIPGKSEFTEWLTFEFRDRNKDSVKLVFRWENLSLSLDFKVDTTKIVLQNFRKELKSLPFWYWRGTYGAAKYCLDNEVNYEEALKWIDQSINVEENFLNLMLKSKLLDKLGRTAESLTLKKYAKKNALDRELAQYAYSFWYSDREKTKQILIEANRRSKSWFTNKALGQFYSYVQDSGNSLKYLKIALKKAPEHQKGKISEAIAKLKK